MKSVMSGVFTVLPGLRKTLKYLRSQFDQVRQHPRPGLINDLLQAEQAGDRLSDDELLSMVFVLLAAGHETTVHLISNSLLTVLQQSDVRHALTDSPSQIEQAGEEFLRYCSPAQFVKPRFVAQDVEFHGQQLKCGDSVVPVLASANCDPDRFEVPTEFRIDRPQNFHVAFGTGPHVCLAMKLARAENEVVLERVLSRWPDFQPSFDPANPDWGRQPGPMRPLRTLPVKVLQRERA